jgi:hypothetical protein
MTFRLEANVKIQKIRTMTVVEKELERGFALIAACFWINKVPGSLILNDYF